MDWLSAKRGCTAVRSVRSVLEALHGGMEGQGWFEKLGALDNPIKLAILEQVAPLEFIASPLDCGPPCMQLSILNSALNMSGWLHGVHWTCALCAVMPAQVPQKL